MDGNNSMTPADIAALTNNGMGDGNSWVWFLLIVLVLGWGVTQRWVKQFILSSSVNMNLE